MMAMIFAIAELFFLSDRSAHRVLKCDVIKN